MTTETTAGVTVLVPAYDEEGAVARVLEQVAHTLARTNHPAEIIVIDDGSRDQTAAQARHAAQNLSVPVRVLRHTQNRGYGAALKTGIRHARHQWICITDADGTYPNERIPDLLRRLQPDAMGGAADMVVGARIGENVAIPPLRRPAKWALGVLANVVAGQRIPDLNSGLRAFHRAAALELFDILPDGFSFTTTITLGMLTNGYLVEYLPIDYHSRVGRSKIRPIQDTLHFLQLILRIALYFAPLKLFLPLSLALLLLALAWGLYSALALDQLADVSTLVIVMMSAQTALIGLLAELINRRVGGYGRGQVARFNGVEEVGGSAPTETTNAETTGAATNASSDEPAPPVAAQNSRRANRHIEERTGERTGERTEE